MADRLWKSATLIVVIAAIGFAVALSMPSQEQVDAAAKLQLDACVADGGEAEACQRYLESVQPMP